MKKTFSNEIFKYEYISLNKTLKEISEEFGVSIGSLNKKVINLKIKKTEEQKFYSKLLNHTCLRRFGVYTPEDIKNFIYKKYIEENVRRSDLSKLLETTVISTERLLKRLGIKKDRNKYKSLMEETCLVKYGQTNPLKSKDVQDKIKKTNIKNIGVDNPFKLESVQNKIQEGNLKRGGNICSVQHPSTKEKIISNNLKNYGVKHNIERPDVIKKRQDTCINKFNYKTPFESSLIQDKVKETNIKSIGVPYPTCSEDFFKKSLETKKKRGTFNTSKPEEILYTLLQEIYKGCTIERQYNQDTRYPFYCDYYIKELDLFIEFQGNWTHGKEPFDGSNLPEIWKVKSETSKYYKNAIDVYSRRDPEKRSYAQKHSLNYLEIWNSDLSKGVPWLVSILTSKTFNKTLVIQ